MTVSRERLAELLDRAKSKRVVVVGDVMLDVYLSGDVERISPEAPVPVVRVRSRTYALGGAANVAQNVMAIGVACDLLAVTGADSAGETLRTMLAAIGADLSYLGPVARCTTQKTRILGRSQQLVRVDEEDDADLSPAELAVVVRRLHETIEHADALVLEDYNKGMLAPALIRIAIDAARARAIPIVVDPKYRNFFDYHGATVFKPNKRELESALGAAVDLAHPETLPASLARLGVEHLLLTLGEQGMMLIAATGEMSRIATTARQVYDVVGAGDTVTAYLAAILAAGATMYEGAFIANIAAGIEVGKLGAAVVTPEEVLQIRDLME